MTCNLLLVFLPQVYVDTVGDAEKYRIKLPEKFPGIKFVVAKKADSLYPVVSGASIVAKVKICQCCRSGFHFHGNRRVHFLQVTRDRALREWVLVETAENMNRNFGSGYPGGCFHFPLHNCVREI